MVEVALGVGLFFGYIVIGFTLHLAAFGAARVDRSLDKPTFVLFWPVWSLLYFVLLLFAGASKLARWVWNKLTAQKHRKESAASAATVSSAQYQGVVRAIDALALGDLRALGTVHEDIQGSVDAIVAKLRAAAPANSGSDAHDDGFAAYDALTMQEKSEINSQHPRYCYAKAYAAGRAARTGVCEETVRDAFVAYMATVGTTDVAWLADGDWPIGTHANKSVLLSVEWKRFAAGYSAALASPKGGKRG